MRIAKLIATTAASLALATAAPAFADDHAMSSEEALAAAIASDIRDGDRARDQYRHPAETLEFFGVEPDMKVGEYAPGGGWYTRILAPYLAEKGQYVGLWFNVPALPFPDASKERIANNAVAFPERIAEWTGIDASNFASTTMNTVGDEHKGTFDRILVFRMMHGLSNWNMLDLEIKAMRDLLKDDGMIGIVQHRAADNASHEYSTGPRGYVSQEGVINLMDFYGFELVGLSEINANPKDTADHAEGVWHNPPSLRGLEDGDAEGRAARMAVGESDRMTLLFRKK